MLNNPRDSVPADQLPLAMEALILTLAQDEPEALLRAMQTLKGSGHGTGTSNPAAVLAEVYLAFAGTPVAGEAADVPLHRFSYSGYILFAVSAGSRRAANRVARAQIAALLESEAPVGAVPGPYPGHEELLDVAFWLSHDEEGGVLELESVDE